MYVYLVTWPLRESETIHVVTLNSGCRFIYGVKFQGCGQEGNAQKGGFCLQLKRHQFYAG